MRGVLECGEFSSLWEAMRAQLAIYRFMSRRSRLSRNEFVPGWSMAKMTAFGV